MSLCPHGYTAFFDCPHCECPGCARPQDSCTCHLEPAVARAAGMDVRTPDCETAGHRRGELAPAAASNDELLAQFAELMLKVNAARFES